MVIPVTSVLSCCPIAAGLNEYGRQKAIRPLYSVAAFYTITIPLISLSCKKKTAAISLPCCVYNTEASVRLINTQQGGISGETMIRPVLVSKGA
jgi:hypothetical protein